MWHRASKCSPAGKLRTDLTKDAPQKPFPWLKEPKARGSIPGWMNIVAFRNGVRICIPRQWPNTAASCIPGRVLLCFPFFFFFHEELCILYTWYVSTTGVTVFSRSSCPLLSQRWPVTLALCPFEKIPLAFHNFLFFWHKRCPKFNL